MTFSERAVFQCHAEMKANRTSNQSVRNVIKYLDTDVSCFYEFLDSKNSYVRKAAIEILATRGKDVDRILKALENETDEHLIYNGLRILSTRKIELSYEVSSLFNSSNPLIKPLLIDLYAKSGNAKLLTHLLFDQDQLIVNRVKKLIEDETRSEEINGKMDAKKSGGDVDESGPLTCSGL